MNENWLTAIFNEHLAGLANAVLGWFNIQAADPKHPWETWLVMELLVVAILIVLVTMLRPRLSAGTRRPPESARWAVCPPSGRPLRLRPGNQCCTAGRP